MRHLIFLGILVIGLFSSADSRAGWQEEWDRTVKAAKKEGRVSMFGPGGPHRRDSLTIPFQKKYGIAVDYLPGRVGGIPPRLAAARRAGHYIWDIVSAGGLEALLLPMNVLDPIEPALILPEVKNKKNWRGGEFEFLDPGRTIFVMNQHQRGVLFINNRQVDPKEFTSYRDLLDPKWKGKIITDDPRTPGPSQSAFLFFYLHPDLGPGFIRELLQQKLLILKNYGQEVDLVGSGKYPVGVGLVEAIAEQRMRQGVPITILDPRQMKEGSDIQAADSQLGLINKAPHPNAAKVYINWLLSKEGQISYVRASGFISNRVDVPTDHTPAWKIPRAGSIKTYGLGPRKIAMEKMVPFVRGVLGR